MSQISAMDLHLHKWIVDNVHQQLLLFDHLETQDMILKPYSPHVHSLQGEYKHLN